MFYLGSGRRVVVDGNLVRYKAPQSRILYTLVVLLVQKHGYHGYHISTNRLNIRGRGRHFFGSPQAENIDTNVPTNFISGVYLYSRISDII